MIVRLDTLPEEKQKIVFDCIRSWVRSPDSGKYIKSNTRSLEINSRGVTPKSLEMLKKMRDAAGFHSTYYIDYVVYDGDEVMGLLGYKLLQSSPEHVALAHDLYLMPIKKIETEDIKAVIDEMFAVAHEVSIEYTDDIFDVQSVIKERSSNVSNTGRFRMYNGSYSEFKKLFAYGKK